MKPLLTTFAVVSLMIAIAGASFLQPSVRPARADFPAASFSTDLVFQCLPGSSMLTGFGWYSSNQGPQWFDLSAFDNDFAFGSFASAGPLDSSQTGLMWEGLTPATWYFVRVNTLTQYGWSPSQTMHFYTPSDCQFQVLPQAVTSTPADCPSLSSHSLSGCVWTGRGDYDTYDIGETVNYCYYVSQPTDVRIVATKPDRTSLVVIDGFVNGTGACLGPFQANTPRGLRSVRMYGGPDGELLSETHFYVR
ncbi:MAG: hypothetical protein GEU75_11755 [Dehalococcoidia bacterium]|nr:hypothetical protein [Dehalococcoidia bacterium]